jgi:hypothetical protein
MSLIEIINKKLNTGSFKLTISQINWINFYINLCPNSFNDITKEITNIIKCSKINLHDIPNIIIIISRIYRNNIIENDIENPENIIVFIKFTIDSILESDLFIVPNIEKHIIESIINSSLDLLKLNINIVKEESECCFFY